MESTLAQVDGAELLAHLIGFSAPSTFLLSVILGLYVVLLS